MANLPAFLTNEYTHALLAVLLAIVASKTFLVLLRKYIHKIAKRTQTDLDDLIVDVISRPVYLVIIITGIFIALRSLSVLEPYTLWINNVFYILFVLVAAYLMSRVLALFVARWLKVQKRFEKTPRLMNLFVSVIIYLLAALMILGYFDVEITPLIATLGLGGLAIGLALQNTLTNFFAGLHIISDRPINIGDFIELEGNISGYVEDIGWRSTKIKTLSNTIVIVPNAKLSESVITNDSMPEQETAALVQVGVGYGSDLKKVEKVTIDVARHIQKNVTGAVKIFEPFIRYHTFGDSNINFTVILRVEKIVDKYLVIHEFIKALKERYDKERIEISWPVRKILQLSK